MSKGLDPGATLPDFELPDHTGTRRRLSELQGSNPMVLLLGRGEHCPRERQHTLELVRFHRWCATALTELVTVLPNELHEVRKLRNSIGAFWTFLSDAEREVQQALDIDEYTDRHHVSTVPHAVVLAPGLEIEKVYVGFWFWGRPSPYDLWADLRELRRRVNPDYDPTTPEAKARWYERHPKAVRA
jgi:peroxiredoxin